MKKISFSLRIGIIGNIEYVKEIFFENLSNLALESNLSEGNYEFLMVFKQIPIKIKMFLAENLENLINDFDNIQKLDIIILTLNLYEVDSQKTINKNLLKDFNEIYSFQGLSVLVGMDIEHIFKKAPPKSFKVSRFQLEKTTKDLDLIYCFEVINKNKDVSEIYYTLFNDFILRFQYSNPELFELAKDY
ncbi:MAG: hypothetical protein ACFFDN_49600, partial [Candidatus Hodarchaeota archaeon]